ncbi:MAG: hypothetical protein COA73_09045 [Candidatus Hydrogenedentota bacterium]|nr:MAG: hypothetical protein COA73_09045 [Candidatus Hydrogenedentota bacterium]
MHLTRRDALLTGAAALTAAASLTPSHAAETDGLKSELLFDMTATLEPPQSIGATHEGNRSIFYATGGTVDGPKVKGTVLPGGGDWFRMRDDGVGELDVRATFKTDDGALIYTHYRGVLIPSTGYFRTTPRFETSAKQYQWLTKIVCVGVGTGGQGQVSYKVYQIL